MKKVVAVLLLVLSSGCSPAMRRRSAQGAACAAGLADILTTRQAMQRGALEANPVLARRDGTVRWNVLIPLKTALCLGPVIAAEVVRNPSVDKAGTGLGVATAGLFGIVAIQNSRIGRIGKGQ